MELEPEPELFESRNQNRNHNFFKSWNWNHNFSKVGTGTGTVKNSYGSTTLEGATLCLIHTPRNTSDHLVLYLEEEKSLYR